MMNQWVRSIYSNNAVKWRVSNETECFWVVQGATPDVPSLKERVTIMTPVTLTATIRGGTVTLGVRFVQVAGRCGAATNSPTAPPCEV